MQEISSSEEIKPKMIVWFSAEWCGPCQKMEKSMLLETSREIGIPLGHAEQTIHPELFSPKIS